MIFLNVLVTGDGETVEGPNGSEVEFISAYRNADDTHLIYAYTVRSGSTAMYMPQLSYRNPDGRQTNPELEEGAWDLAPEFIQFLRSLASRRRTRW